MPYRQLVDELCDFLDGDTDEIVKRLDDEMRAAASDARVRAGRAPARPARPPCSKAIEKQQMVADRNEDIDVIGIADDDLEAAVQVFYVRKGRVVGRKGFVLDKVEELTPGGLVDRILEEMYGDEPPTGVPKQVLVPVEPDDLATYEEWLCHAARLAGADPRAAAGRQARCTRRSTRNAEGGVHAPPPAPGRRSQHAQPGAHRAAGPAGLPEAPLRIECYDMAHLQGTDYVGSMVVLEDGLPNKREYRRFKVKDVPGNDDYAAMEEVLTRRLTAYLDERDRPIDERGERPGEVRVPAAAAARRRRQGSARRRRARRRDRSASPTRSRLPSSPSGSRRCSCPGRSRSGRDAAGERGAVHAATHPRRGPPLRQHVPPRAARRSG